MTIQDVLRHIESASTNDAELIDVREKDEFEAGHVPGSRNVPLMGVLLNPDNFFDKAKTYYLICESGGRSLCGAEHLHELGFQVINVLGGMEAYWNYIGKRSQA
ncbi:rhodanese-like domain-containing protein [Culicoidibacter larvae]|uniref:Rhodanese-like domain-containing protein n=2 Tax=Culicoidibacter larvae TaxID=2579976 RepID=A0A5R8Q8A5_9FIRM|nr:rhodanese-like domain-containing protein [Culicoidibacter larvae]